MKRMLCILAVMTLGVRAQAGLFSPEAVSGALWGGLIGGLASHGHGSHGAEAIGIGAGAGFLLGSLAHREHSHYQMPPHVADDAWPPAALPAPVDPPPTMTAPPAAATPPAPAAAPAPVPARASRMQGANRLFGR